MLQTIVRTPRTAEDIALGARLAKMQNRPIGPESIARILKDAKVKYVIVGAHAANGYTGRPRATVDVDVIAQFPKKAVRAIAAAYPKLQIRDTLVVTRFMDQDLEAIDVMKPMASKLWSRLLKETREVLIEKETVRVPVLEGVIAAKFSAMVSALRRLPDKKQDAVDFIRIVESNANINLPFLSELAELVYVGGGAEVLKLLEDVRAGRPLQF